MMSVTLRKSAIAFSQASSNECLKQILVTAGFEPVLIQGENLWTSCSFSKYLKHHIIFSYFVHGYDWFFVCHMWIYKQNDWIPWCLVHPSAEMAGLRLHNYVILFNQLFLHLIYQLIQMRLLETRSIIHKLFTVVQLCYWCLELLCY